MAYVYTSEPRLHIVPIQTGIDYISDNFVLAQSPQSSIEFGYSYYYPAIVVFW